MIKKQQWEEHKVKQEVIIKDNSQNHLAIIEMLTKIKEEIEILIKKKKKINHVNENLKFIFDIIIKLYY